MSLLSKEIILNGHTGSPGHINLKALCPLDPAFKQETNKQTGHKGQKHFLKQFQICTISFLSWAVLLTRNPQSDWLISWWERDTQGEIHTDVVSQWPALSAQNDKNANVWKSWDFLKQSSTWSLSIWCFNKETDAAIFLCQLVSWRRVCGGCIWGPQSNLKLQPRKNCPVDYCSSGVWVFLYISNAGSLLMPFIKTRIIWALPNSNVLRKDHSGNFYHQERNWQRCIHSRISHFFYNRGFP